jgi:hypothetical protein
MTTKLIWGRKPNSFNRAPSLPPLTIKVHILNPGCKTIWHRMSIEPSLKNLVYRPHIYIWYYVRWQLNKNMFPSIKTNCQFCPPLTEDNDNSPLHWQKTINSALHWQKTMTILPSIKRQWQFSPPLTEDNQFCPPLTEDNDNSPFHWQKTINSALHWQKTINSALHWQKTINSPLHW